MLFKEIVDARTDARTHGRTDDGRRTLKDHKSSLEHFVLRWANKQGLMKKIELTTPPQSDIPKFVIELDLTLYCFSHTNMAFYTTVLTSHPIFLH